MNWLWDNLGLKREERSRYNVLIGILLLLLFCKFFMAVVYEPEGYHVDATVLDSVKMVSIEQKKFKPFTKTEKRTYQDKKPQPKDNFAKNAQKKPVQSFRFNPNTISKDSLKLLGLSNYAINSIMKYRSKGGKFRSVDQIKKVNGIDATTLDRIIPLLDLPVKKKEPFKNTIKQDSNKSKPTHKYTKYEKKKPSKIEINSADTTGYQNLYGIGKVYSKRIIKYRKSLGGFFNVEQIKEVWGISDSLYQTLLPYLEIDTDEISKQNINNLDRKGLEQHPYIDWRKSKAIIAYRDTHGAYKSMDDFYKLYGIEKEFVDTLKIYFDVE